ncbi:hypothetical protein FE784_13615 [Paenibacillus hemerocallicola]|uniref:Amidase n=1 Tax=Paenibacillus hemerocallicola TaxID=1172614 RepID=A0A5C4T9F4_9BACL|nr:hypothetical protein [Paenibacillus hemerocallicola]TNJ65688.1 hypothetical protein FE784_13615 [Paenibacillus hemerocallicola]
MKTKDYRFAAKTFILCLALLQAVMYLPPQADVSRKASAEQRSVAATWMWNTYAIWRDKDQTLQYLTQNGINLVYLQVDKEIPVDVYRTFIREAGARGIEIHALGGKPYWALPERQGEMYEFIYWVKAYNNSSRSAERFNGIHLDVEPYVLPQWRYDQDTVIGHWMDTVSGFVEEVKSDSYLTTGADFPVWLDRFLVPDGKGDTTTLTDWFFGRLDQITLMAYIDNAPDIVKAVTKELNEAAGKPVIIGMETMDNDEANTSFYALGRSQLTGELNTVVQALSGHPSYAGYAIHEYDSWVMLRD